MKINLKPLTDLIHGDQKPEKNDDSDVHLNFLKEHHRHGARVFQVKVFFNPITAEYRPEKPFDFIFDNNKDLDIHKPEFVLNADSEKNYENTYLVREEILKRTISRFHLEGDQIFRSAIRLTSPNNYHLEILLFVDKLEDINKLTLKEMFFVQYVKNLEEEIKELIQQTLKAHKDAEFQKKILSNTHTHLSKLFSEAFELYQYCIRYRDPEAVNYCTICQGIAAIIKNIEHEHPSELEGIENYDEPFLLGLHDFQRNQDGLVISKWVEWEKEMDTTTVFANLTIPKKDESIIPAEKYEFKINDSDNTKSYINRIVAAKRALSLEIKVNMNFDVFYYDLLVQYARTLRQVFINQKGKINTYTPHRPDLVATYFSKERVKFTGTPFDKIEDAPDYLQDNLHWCIEAQAGLLDELIHQMDEVFSQLEIEGQKSSGHGSSAPVPPPYYHSPHYEEHAYMISPLVQKVKDIEDLDKQLSYMWEARNEYKYFFGEKINVWGSSFAEEVDKEIQKLTITRASKPPVEQEVVEHKIEQKAEGFKKLKWNGQINILADIFYQLTNDAEINGKKVLEAEKQEIVDFLCRNFLDKDGNELSASSLATSLSPTRSDKRPKAHKQINVQKHFEKK